MKSLRVANIAFATMVLLRILDQGYNQPERLMPGSSDAIGALLFAAAAVSCLLAFQHLPIAPKFSIGLGAAGLAIVVLVNLLPQWSGFISDPYYHFAGFASWILLGGFAAASGWLAYRGWRTLKGMASPVGSYLAPRHSSASAASVPALTLRDDEHIEVPGSPLRSEAPLPRLESPFIDRR